jgi:hypothetical protein
MAGNNMRTPIPDSAPTAIPPVDPAMEVRGKTAKHVKMESLLCRTASVLVSVKPGTGWIPLVPSLRVVRVLLTA